MNAINAYRHFRPTLPADVLLAVKLGDFWELYSSDATTAAPLLDSVITRRGETLMTAFPYHAKSSSIRTLLADGYRVATLEQAGGEWRISEIHAPDA